MFPSGEALLFFLLLLVLRDLLGGIAEDVTETFLRVDDNDDEGSDGRETCPIRIRRWKGTRRDEYPYGRVLTVYISQGGIIAFE